MKQANAQLLDNLAKINAKDYADQKAIRDASDKQKQEDQDQFAMTGVTEMSQDTGIKKGDIAIAISYEGVNHFMNSLSSFIQANVRHVIREEINNVMGQLANVLDQTTAQMNVNQIVHDSLAQVMAEPVKPRRRFNIKKQHFAPVQETERPTEIIFEDSAATIQEELERELGLIKEVELFAGRKGDYNELDNHRIDKVNKEMKSTLRNTGIVLDLPRTSKGLDWAQIEETEESFFDCLHQSFEVAIEQGVDIRVGKHFKRLGTDFNGIYQRFTVRFKGEKGKWTVVAEEYLEGRTH